MLDNCAYFVLCINESGKYIFLIEGSKVSSYVNGAAGEDKLSRCLIKLLW